MHINQFSIMLSALFVIASVAACSEGEDGKERGDRRGVLNGYLVVPEMLVYDQVPGWFDPKELDKSTDILLLFPGKVLKDELPFYEGGGRVDGSLDEILVSVAKLSDEEIRRYKNPEFFDELKSKIDKYGQGEIVRNPETGFYRVPVIPSAGTWWYYLSVDPKEFGDQLSYSEHWVASCQLTAPMNLVSCRTSVIWKDLLIEFSVYKNDIKNIDALKEFFVETIKEFRMEAKKEI